MRVGGGLVVVVVLVGLRRAGVVLDQAGLVAERGRLRRGAVDALVAGLDGGQRLRAVDAGAVLVVAVATARPALGLLVVVVDGRHVAPLGLQVPPLAKEVPDGRGGAHLAGARLAGLHVAGLAEFGVGVGPGPGPVGVGPSRHALHPLHILPVAVLVHAH